MVSEKHYCGLIDRFVAINKEIVPNAFEFPHARRRDTRLALQGLREKRYEERRAVKARVYTFILEVATQIPHFKLQNPVKHIEATL